jgi:hypothetical protein
MFGLVGELSAQCLGEASKPELADGIRRHEWMADLAQDGSDVDQGRRFAATEHGKHGARAIHRTVEVGFDDAPIAPRMGLRPAARTE